MEISGRAAVVTGGGGGLGAASARALAAAGAAVTLIDVSEAAVRPVADAIGGRYAVCDVTDAAAVEAVMADSADAHGPTRVAVCCAGIAPAQKIVGRDGAMALAAFANVISINLVGTFNVMRLAAAQMAAADPIGEERGVIINTASVAAFEGQIGQAAYAASKGGVAALTLPAAREFARAGIRVMAIAPGLFGTPLLHNMPQAVQDSLAATVPFPTRFGTPDEFAALIMHILANPMLNGEVIRLDGALRMQPR